MSLLDLLNQDFARNALLAGAIVAVVSAVVGYFVVLRAQAFAAHALSHIGFAGATGAALLHLDALVGMFALTLLAAAGMGSLGARIRGRDVEIGMVLSLALGLGVLFLSLYTNSASETVGVLFGSILSVTPRAVQITLITGAGILIGLGIIWRPLLFASIDPEVARARGVPVRALGVVFLLLLALAVAQAIQVVGVLLLFALLVAPAATAAQLVRRPFATVGLAIALSLAWTWGGLLLAFTSRWPVSFAIAALAGCAYFAAGGIRRWRVPRRYHAPPHPTREYP
ncbi:MAG TPA: metal ABC transporter permease [Chloroflexia bacterium]|nr:metal ABC transporter permease [Chloroflexia bacterium]